MEIDLKDPKTPSLNGFHSAAIQIPGAAAPTPRSSNYTSLKDILHSQSPSTSSPPAPSAATAAAAVATFPPTPTRSWNEIPIRNPLVKHAAMAYLQPMSTPTASFRGKGCAARLADKCCACLGGGDGDGDGEELGCVAWLCDAVSRAVRGIFGGERLGDYESDTDDEEDDDKVD